MTTKDGLDNKNKINVKDKRLVRPLIFLQDEQQEQQKRYLATAHQLTSVVIDRCKFSFPTPNPAALFLNVSLREKSLALDLHERLFLTQVKPGETVDISDAQLPLLLDYLEHIQTSVVSAYSAIEAFSNSVIANDYTIQRKNTKGVTEIWSKENIERWFKTTKKIRDLLPLILKCEPP